MDTDKKPDLHLSDNSKLLMKEETHQIIGCAFEVLNAIGHGLSEKIYENALVVEFNLRGIPCNQQKRSPVHFKSVQVGEFVPDLIVFESVIVDTKTIDCITDSERGKMTDYLRVAKLRIGLILNFKNPRLEWDRIVL